MRVPQNGGAYPQQPYPYPNGGGQASCQGYCNAGYVQTSYGCLPQYTCPPCSGYMQMNGFNAYCVR